MSKLDEKKIIQILSHDESVDQILEAIAVIGDWYPSATDAEIKEAIRRILEKWILGDYL